MEWVKLKNIVKPKINIMLSAIILPNFKGTNKQFGIVLIITTSLDALIFWGCM